MDFLAPGREACRLLQPRNIDHYSLGLGAASNRLCVRGRVRASDGADELHHQYLLGFVPQKLDGKLHDLTVKVNKSGYTVRARKRYLAPRG